MKELEHIKANTGEFLTYLKSKFPLYHDSNVFLRDLHYGVMSYAEEKLKKKLRYLDAELVALGVAEELERQGVFKRVDARTWLLNYQDFALPRPVPAVKQPVQPAPAPAAK